MEPALPPREDDGWDVDDEFAPEKRKRARYDHYDEADDRPVVVRRGRRLPWWVLIGCFGCLFLCCALPFCLGLAGSAAVAFYASSESTNQGSLREDVDPDTTITLTVENRVGDVTLRPGQDDEIVVDYWQKAYGWSKEEARLKLDDLSVTVEQPTDGEVVVRVNSAPTTENDLPFFADDVDLTLTVPPDLYLAIKTNNGAVHVQGITAHSLDITTSAGDVLFAGDIGPNVRETYHIKSSTGEIDVQLLADTYLKVDAKSSIGDVTVSTLFEDRSELHASNEVIGDAWTGILGTGSEDSPTLTIRSDTGGIMITPR